MGFITESSLFEAQDIRPVASCASCSRHSQSKLRFTGNGDAGVLVVGAMPTKEEDYCGSYGKGPLFEYLQEWVPDILRNYYYTTVVNCQGKIPTYEDIQNCSPRLNSLIQKLDPHTIIAMGETAFYALIGSRFIGRISGIPWTDFIGHVIPDQDMGRNIIVTRDIEYFLQRKEYDDGNKGQQLYKSDPSQLKNFVALFEKSLTLKKPTEITIPFYTTTDTKEAITILKDALTWKSVAFDYETTGLKPFRKGHEILYVSVADKDMSYAFPFFNNSPEFLEAFKALMLSSVPKIVHNAQYEWLWTRVLLGYWPKNLHDDIMLTAHTLYSSISKGLKFLVYINFGLLGYDGDMDYYIKSGEEGSHGFNRMKEAPVQKALQYNAYDSWFTMLLHERYKPTTRFLQSGRDLLYESAETLVKATYHGLGVDMNVLRDAQVPLLKEMEELHTKIMNSDEVKKWDKQDEPFEYTSSKKLSRLLFTILKIEPVAFTDTGLPAVDEEALRKYSVPFLSDILAWRKLSKITGTYIQQYIREEIYNKVHPSFLLHTVKTIRSSCADPNIQQNPARNKRAKDVLRKFIKPTEGNRFGSYDYKSLEVIINCCHSKDPMLRKYIEDPSTDMHRDGAMDVFMLTKEEVKKPIRNAVKGDFIFAEFYGSYYVEVALALWEDAEELQLKEHLASKGIKAYKDFEQHVKRCEEILWKERFPVHAEWRKGQWEFYKQHGYIESLTGFRVMGPMSRNNAFNTAVQGDAYHVNQWAMNQVQKKIERLEHSWYFGEIHDAQETDMHPDEEEMIDYWIWLYGTKKVREHWNWIDCPLTIEKERSEINGNWAEMTECGPLTF